MQLVSRHIYIYKAYKVRGRLACNWDIILLVARRTGRWEDGVIIFFFILPVNLSLWPAIIMPFLEIFL